MKIGSILRIALGVIIGTPICFYVILATMITSLLFFPQKEYLDHPENYGMSYERVRLKTKENFELVSWFLPAKNPKSTLLFFHGNAGNISGRLYKARGWVERGYSVLLAEYRGYGASTGEIRHENDLVEDAEIYFKWLIDEKKIPLKHLVFYGESLGTYPAIRLAALYPAAALILESPYTSFKELAPLHYPWIPSMMVASMLKDFSFLNKNFIPQIKTPLFVLHGTRDPTCPFSQGQALFALAPEPKLFWAIEDGDHNDLPSHAGQNFWDKPAAFLVVMTKHQETNTK